MGRGIGMQVVTRATTGTQDYGSVSEDPADATRPRLQQAPWPGVATHQGEGQHASLGQVKWTGVRRDAEDAASALVGARQWALQAVSWGIFKWTSDFICLI